MTESALPKPSRFPPWLLPVGLFVVLMVMLLAIVLLARQAGKSDVPPEPGAFVLPTTLDYTAYDVERSDNGALKLTTGAGQQSVTIDVQLGAAHVWLLEPATVADVKPPMVVNVISIPNEVRNYTIKLLALAPAPANATFDGPFVPLADGFAGYETSRDTTERAVVSVILESFDGRNGVTQTSTGPGTLYIDADAPLRAIRQGTAADVHSGDRVALHLGADGKPDPSQGILVLTGGTR
ncbi:MAG: hypothetical protein ABI577_02215 [bacterium]